MTILLSKKELIVNVWKRKSLVTLYLNSTLNIFQMMVKASACTVYQKENLFCMHQLKNNAGRDYFYGTDLIVENWFARLESRWSQIISKIICDETIPTSSNDYTFLLMFISLSLSRTAQVADYFSEVSALLTKRIAKLAQVHGQIDINDAEIDQLKININNPNLPFIQSMPTEVSILSDLCPILIKNHSNKQFITSDYPVLRYNQLFMKLHLSMKVLITLW